MRRMWMALLVLVGGCASDAPVPMGDAERLREALASKDRPRQVVTTKDDGLSVRKVAVREDESVIGEVLARYSQGPVLGEGETAQLSRNGLRLIRLKMEDIDRMLEELGGAGFDAVEWRGQVLEWSPIYQRRVARGQVLAVDGRVTKISSGQLRLMVRSWTLMREDGPFVNVQLRPEVLRREATNDLRAALEGRPQTEADVLPTLACEFALESGSVYALAPERPGIERGEHGGRAEASEEGLGARVGGVRIGPVQDVGPEAAAPQTVGELMLMSEGTEAQRGLILLVPHISERLRTGLALSEEQNTEGGRR